MLDQYLNHQPVETPDAIVRRLNLAKTAGDTGFLKAAVEEAISENPKALEDYRNGKARCDQFPRWTGYEKDTGESRSW